MDPENQNSSTTPNRKWTNDEVQIILTYLQQTSAQTTPPKEIPPKNVTESSGVAAKLNFLKEKVINVGSTVKKATSQWLTQPGSVDTQRTQVLQMCPGNQQLKESQTWTDYNVDGHGNTFIADETIRIPTALSDSARDKVLTMTRRDMEISYLAHGPVLDIHPTTSYLSNPRARTPTDTSIAKKPYEFVEKLKKFKKSSAAYLGSLQAKRAEKLKSKFEWERTEQEKGIEMREKKLVLEEEWTKAEIELKRKELELKEKEIDKDEKLKILEMEKEERLRKYELELKYKCGEC